MRCKHLNGVLIEFSLVGTDFDVSSGVVDPIGYHSTGEPIGYEYRCDDCKKSWKSKSLMSFKPKWLKSIAEQLYN